MQIRSITYTINFDNLSDIIYQDAIKVNLEKMRKNFANKNIEIRTIRLNIIAIKNIQRIDMFLFTNKIEFLSNLAKSMGIRWFNISFDLTNNGKKDIDLISNLSYNLIKRFNNIFINFIVAKDFINPYAVFKSAKTIIDISKLSFNGFDNFRFGVSLNPSYNTPFFPFSSSNCNDSFSIAVETSLTVEQSIKKHIKKNYDEIKNIVVNELISYVKTIENICLDLENSLNIRYNGQDLSLAPYPDENISVIDILKLLGLDDIGSSGTQFLTSYLTSILKETIKKSNIRAVGFNGVMYSLLEDKKMCESNNKKNISIDSIILYSTVCGCGLDMVPVPGNILSEELASMILDVATTAIKLNKPLGVRVLPIPNVDMNEFTNFDMDFLTNTRVLNIKNLHMNYNFFNLDKFEMVVRND